MGWKKYEQRVDFGSLFLGDGYHAYEAKEEDGVLTLYVKSTVNTCTCPTCGTASSEVCAVYPRTVQDWPIHGLTTYLEIKAQEYVCGNPECPVKTFSEQLPFARAGAHRTEALDAMIMGVAIYISFHGASMVLSLLGVKVSHDVIRRLYNSLEFEDNPDVEEIGVDDVANRKGRSYLTVIYDMETHQMIALLDGRDGKTFKEWLKGHKKVRIVARDRASAYAAAIREALPECVQVADRFHLLQNIIDRLKDVFKDNVPSKIFIRDGEILDKEPARKTAAPAPDDAVLDAIAFDNEPPLDADGDPIEYDNSLLYRNSKQAKRTAEDRKKKHDLILEVQEYSADNAATPEEVSDKFGIKASKAKKYMDMPQDKVQGILAPRRSRHSIIDDYINIIYKMLMEGHSESTVYHYVLRQGFSGSARTLYEYICNITKNNFPLRSPLASYQFWQNRYPDDVTVIRRSDLLTHVLTLNPNATQDKAIKDNLDAIKKKYPIVEFAEQSFKDFHSILMGDSTEALDEFLVEHAGDELSGFCKGISMDIDAVKNAVSTDVSSGFVEGSNNKFKLIKRIGYGRLNLSGLWKRCAVAFSCKLKNFSLRKLLRSAVHT